MRQDVITIAALALAAPASAQAKDDTIELRHGTMIVRLIPFGATVTQIHVPDRAGKRANVLLGFATPAEFRAKNGKVSFGSTIRHRAGR